MDRLRVIAQKQWMMKTKMSHNLCAINYNDTYSTYKCSIIKVEIKFVLCLHATKGSVNNFAISKAKNTQYNDMLRQSVIFHKHTVDCGTVWFSWCSMPFTYFSPKKAGNKLVCFSPQLCLDGDILSNEDNHL